MKITTFAMMNALKKTEIFSHVAISKRKRDDYDDDLENSTVKTSRHAMLTMLVNDDLTKLQNAIIERTSISQTMIATALMTEDTASARADIPTPLTYSETIKDPVWGEL